MCIRDRSTSIGYRTCFFFNNWTFCSSKQDTLKLYHLDVKNFLKVSQVIVNTWLAAWIRHEFRVRGLSCLLVKIQNDLNLKKTIWRGWHIFFLRSRNLNDNLSKWYTRSWRSKSKRKSSEFLFVFVLIVFGWNGWWIDFIFVSIFIIHRLKIYFHGKQNSIMLWYDSYNVRITREEKRGT